MELSNSNDVVNDEGVVAGSWQDGLDADIKSNESLKSFNNVNDLARGYLSLASDNKAFSNISNSITGGSKVNDSNVDQIFIPSSDANSDDWNKFYDTLGRPGDKKYLVDRKSEDESVLSSYEELFFNAGLSKSQGEAILNKMYQVQDESSKNQKEHLEKVKHENLGALFGKYGDAFDQKVRVAISAMDKYGSSDLAQLVEESNYNPAIIDMLVRVGETLQPESIVTSDSHSNETPEYALKEINRLENDNDFMQRYKDRRHEEHKSAVEKMDELYRLAYKK